MSSLRVPKPLTAPSSHMLYHGTLLPQSLPLILSGGNAFYWGSSGPTCLSEQHSTFLLSAQPPVPRAIPTSLCSASLSHSPCSHLIYQFTKCEHVAGCLIHSSTLSAVCRFPGSRSLITHLVILALFHPQSHSHSLLIYWMTTRLVNDVAFSSGAPFTHIDRFQVSWMVV